MTPTTPKVDPSKVVVVEPKKLPRFEQVIQEGGQTKRVIWLEISEEKWKRFDSEKDANEYKPVDAHKAEEKGESSKTGE